MTVPEIYTHKNIEENLKSLGWEPLKKKENTFPSDYLILPILETQLYHLNKHIPEEDKKEAIKRAIDKLKNSDEVAILDYLKKGVPITINKGQKGVVHYNVTLISNKIEENLFNYAHELKFKGEPNIEPDFTLFINGIPVVIIEAKREITEKETVEKAINQIKRYEFQAPELFKYVQFAIAYGDRDRYLPTCPNRIKEERFKAGYKWRNEDNKEDIFDLLKKERLVDIIKNFILFIKSNDESIRIIPRYMQYWAVKKAFERIKAYLNGKSKKNKGLIWHWQGSGKTFEIIYLSNLFFKTFKERDPIVFIIVDRRDLENQFRNIILSLKNLEFSPNHIDSIEKLKEEITHIKEAEENKYKTISGVYLVMIHKFDINKFEDFLKNYGQINKKEILILRDEVHRTEAGRLSTLKNRIFKNAIKIGFTGTPINREDYTTFNDYAYPLEGEYYLHKFFIKDSIEEGFTVRLVWRITNPEDIKLNLTEEDVKALIDMYDPYIDINPDEVKISLSDLLNSEEVIKNASKYIAENVKEDTENFKFKAMVVAQSRETCIKFKEYILKYAKEMDEDDVEVVITYQHNDSPTIEKYKNSLFDRFDIKNTEEINKRIAENFKNEDKPKILIVDKKLLTGYDVPRLKVMYILQVLKGHTLLQATARANRPYKGKKFGLIVDMVGHLIEAYRKAVEIYEMYESDIREDVLKYLYINHEEIWQDFLRKLEEFKRLFKEVTNIEFEEFMKIKNKKEFREYVAKIVLHKYGDLLYNHLREVITLFEALGAYEKKIDYYKIYDWLKTLSSGIYRYKNPKKDIPIKEIKKELLKYVNFNNYVDIGEIEINEEFLSNLKTNFVTFTGFVFSVLSYIESKQEPLYKELYKNLKIAIDAYKNKNKSIEELLKEFNSAVNYIKNHEKVKNSLSKEDFLIYEIEHFLKIKGFNVKLNKIKQQIKKLFRKNSITPRDIKILEIYLKIDLRKYIKDKDKVDKLVYEISEEIIKPSVKTWN